MSLTAEQQNEFARFPAVLTALVEAELAADNTAVAMGHGHPAAPVAASIKLGKKISTRPRASGDGLRFHERDNNHPGEFTDAAQHFFVLEAADPPPPEPNMDAIREEFAERVLKSDEERFWEMR